MFSQSESSRSKSDSPIMPSTSALDTSDRKSLDNLMDRLKEMQKRSVFERLKSPQNKPVSPHRKRTSTNDSKHARNIQTSKITSWLKKKPEKERPALDITTVPDKKAEKIVPDKKAQKIKSKQEKDDLFEKYGVRIPSVAEIKERQRKYDQHKEIVSKCTLHEDTNQSFKKLESSPQKNRSANLSCKYLNEKDITWYFSKFEKQLRDIMTGKEFSDRHQRFHNFQKQYEHTTKDLTYNTSTQVFTGDQQHQMVDLMLEKFDADPTKTKYFFQVLLPELCLMTFMDEHQMTKSEALSYLDNIPLD